ncbi:MAG: hypothetical protein FWC03_06185 [Treponema sp.]|nr:hypothetical protein [Treponema sp.]
MDICKYVLNTDNPPPLSEEDQKLMADLKNRPIDYSDIPESTPEELRKGRLLAIEMRKRKMFSLRIHDSTINWWKQNVGEGYTTIMARLLDEAILHPEWIKACFSASVPVSLRELCR